MKNTTTITKVETAGKENISLEFNKVGVASIGITSAFIGCWAVACLVSGMVSSGGPVSLVANFVRTLVG